MRGWSYKVLTSGETSDVAGGPAAYDFHRAVVVPRGARPLAHADLAATAESRVSGATAAAADERTQWGPVAAEIRSEARHRDDVFDLFSVGGLTHSIVRDSLFLLSIDRPENSVRVASRHPTPRCVAPMQSDGVDLPRSVDGLDCGFGTRIHPRPPPAPRESCDGGGGVPSAPSVPRRSLSIVDDEAARSAYARLDMHVSAGTIATLQPAFSYESKPVITLVNGVLEISRSAALEIADLYTEAAIFCTTLPGIFARSVVEAVPSHWTSHAQRAATRVREAAARRGEAPSAAPPADGAAAVHGKDEAASEPVAASPAVAASPEADVWSAGIHRLEQTVSRPGVASPTDRMRAFDAVRTAQRGAYGGDTPIETLWRCWSLLHVYIVARLAELFSRGAHEYVVSELGEAEADKTTLPELVSRFQGAVDSFPISFAFAEESGEYEPVRDDAEASARDAATQLASEILACGSVHGARGKQKGAGATPIGQLADDANLLSRRTFLDFSRRAAFARLEYDDTERLCDEGIGLRLRREARSAPYMPLSYRGREQHGVALAQGVDDEIDAAAGHEDDEAMLPSIGV